MTKEVWRPVVGYEDLYVVSDLGRVRSFDRIDSMGRLRRGRILRDKPHNNGYVRVTLCRDGVEDTRYIHRLVAEAFIENSNYLPEVNHKDENKKNNCSWNLEWCDRQYNNTYGNAPRHKEHAVLQFTPDGKFLAKYNSISEASAKSNVCFASISKSCRRVRRLGGKYVWKYAAEYKRCALG